ncbi:hypothetical protein KCU61_g175, partial [Aureobasidium melanogenum]
MHHSTVRDHHSECSDNYLARRKEQEKALPLPRLDGLFHLPDHRLESNAFIAVTNQPRLHLLSQPLESLAQRHSRTFLLLRDCGASQRDRGSRLAVAAGGVVASTVRISSTAKNMASASSSVPPASALATLMRSTFVAEDVHLVGVDDGFAEGGSSILSASKVCVFIVFVVSILG